MWQWLLIFLLAPVVSCLSWAWVQWLLQEAIHVSTIYPVLYLGLSIAGLIYISIYEYLTPTWLDFKQALRERLQGWGTYVPWLLFIPTSIGFFISQAMGVSIGHQFFFFQITSCISELGLKRTKHPQVLAWFLGASFGLLTGSWLAGGIFGWEWNPSKLKSWNLPGSIFISWCTFQLRDILLTSTPLPLQPALNLPQLTVELGFWRGVWIFSTLVFIIPILHRFHESFIQQFQARLKKPKYRMLAGTAVTVLICYLTSKQLQGTGIELFKATQAGQALGVTPLLKLIATSIGIAAGFPFGTFIPFLFVGSGIGASIAQVFGWELMPWIAVGTFSLYGYSERIPWTCTFLAWQFFGFGPAVVTLMLSMGNNQSMRFIKFNTANFRRPEANQTSS